MELESRNDGKVRLWFDEQGMMRRRLRFGGWGR